jgi:uncharacterized protein (DUF305 family)
VTIDLASAHQPAVDDSGGGAGEPGVEGAERETAELWWRQPWKLIVLGAALVLLGLAGGYAFFGGPSAPKMDAVDVGFLQDMHTHHDQAVSMSFIYLDKPAAEQDPVLRSIAKTIIDEQQYESGYMVGLLLDAHQPAVNDSDQVMAWMNEPLPADRMPGLATQAQLDQLKAASGPSADRLYAELMIAHHQGGIHMAEYAAGHAGRADVRHLATNMISGQRGDIYELQNALTRANS